MRLLIFSDVHRDKLALEMVLRKRHDENTLAISLGDTELNQSFLDKHNIISIKGNYPFDPGIAFEHELEMFGKRFLLTHGHKYDVRSGIEKLYERMLETNTNIALFGHTHVLAFHQVKDKYLANPGAINRSRGSGIESYLIIEDSFGQISFQWYNAKTHDLIEEIIR